MNKPIVISKQAFNQAEMKDKGIEKIPRFLDQELGLDVKCPKCKNDVNFQIFCEMDLISFNSVIDHLNQIWRIEAPNFGPMKIKELKCLSCGTKDDLDKFKGNIK